MPGGAERGVGVLCKGRGPVCARRGSLRAGAIARASGAPGATSLGCPWRTADGTRRRCSMAGDQSRGEGKQEEVPRDEGAHPGVSEGDGAKRGRLEEGRTDGDGCRHVEEDPRDAAAKDDGAGFPVAQRPRRRRADGAGCAPVPFPSEPRPIDEHGGGAMAPNIRPWWLFRGSAKTENFWEEKPEEGEEKGGSGGGEGREEGRLGFGED